MNKKRMVALAAVLILVCGGVMMSGAFGLPTGQRNDHLRHVTDNKIALHIGEKTFVVTLYDNPTAHDLLVRLPLTVKANNYPGYDEKVIRLSDALSMQGAPRGDNPEIPEVGYYHPGQWLALYYGPIGYWSGKVPLGRIDASLDELRNIPDNAPVSIERLQH